MTTVRRFRSEHGIPPKTQLELRLVETGRGTVSVRRGFESEVMRLAGVSGISVARHRRREHGSARLLVQGETVLVPVGDLIDLDAERERLQKRLDASRGRARARSEAKLANPGFRDKAPEDVVLRREAEGRTLRTRGRVAAGTAGRARVMRFEEAVARLDRRQPEHMPEPSLDRIRAVSELLDDPQLTYPTIHVTGTNGKTTIARAAADIACAHGVKTGLFTSPHLRTVRERLSRLRRRRSPRQEFAEEWAHLEPLPRGRRRAEHGDRPTSKRSRRSPSCGSRTSRSGLAVFEVGMGGSWDATNLVAGDVAVIGEIGLDHPELGSTVQEVATEKAGIIKPGKIVVVREQPDDALKVIEARASDVGATVLLEERDWEVEVRLPAVGGQQFRVRGVHATYDELFLPMFGEHAVRNAAAAIVAVESFARARARSGRHPARDRCAADPRTPRGDHARRR